MVRQRPVGGSAGTVRRVQRLCSRCGGIIEIGRDTECPSCGVGFATGPPQVLRKTEQDEESLHRAQQAAFERMREGQRLALVGCAFAVYGLDDAWTGTRWVGGYGGHDARIDEVVLAHGDPRDRDAALVHVRTAVPAGPAPESTYRFATRRLAEAAWREGAPHAGAVHSTFNERDPTAGWSPLAVTVAGEAREFRSIVAPAAWVALADLDGAVVSVTARHVETDDVRLVTVDDLERYLRDDPFR
jgi:ribosomal protein S27AE